MGSTPDVTRVSSSNIREAVTFERMTVDMGVYHNIGCSVHEWTGEDRDGRPLVVIWIAGKRRGLLFAAYEMTA